MTCLGTTRKCTHQTCKNWQMTGSGSTCHTFTLNALHQGLVFQQQNSISFVDIIRASLLTGYYPHRLGLQRSGVGRYHPYGLDTDYKILPQFLSQAGYKSHLVGKWHLGKFMNANPWFENNFFQSGFCKKEFLPNHRGFDSFFGQWSHVVDYYTRVSPVKADGRNKDARKAGYDLHYNDDITYEYEGCKTKT